MAIPSSLIEHHDDGQGAETARRQFICFKVGSEEYGVSITSVREIRAWTDTRPLPNSPTFIRGVINLRGAIVPIFDIRARFGLGLTETTKRHVVIVVAVDSRQFGILVDAVSDILAVPEDEIADMPAMGRQIDDEYLDGLVTLDERMVALIALEKLLNPKAMALVDEIARLGRHRPHEEDQDDAWSGKLLSSPEDGG